jgi:hypothetical protein
MPLSLADFVMTHPPAAGTGLHLVHCTTVQSTVEAVTDGSLRPSLCSVYGCDLLYMFYGRPAYKPNANLPASGIIELAPVCLVLDPILLGAAVRVLPFDSGGFPRYEPLLGLGLTLPQFELGTDPSAPLRFVRAFYETNLNYYEQHATLSEGALPVSRTAPRAYARLIADPSLRDVDDRCGTVEVQLSTTVSLKAALKAVVGPTSLFADPEIETALADCPGVVPLPYKTYGRSEPGNFIYALYERVESFLRDQGSFG